MAIAGNARRRDPVVFNRHCAHGNPNLSRAFDHYASATRRCVISPSGGWPCRGVNIATICTDDVEIVQRMTTDAAPARGATAFGRKTLRAFGADPDGWALE